MIRIEQDEIKSIIAAHYGIMEDSVCLYHDYEFVRKGDDKKRRDYVYAIIDMRNSANSRRVNNA